MCCFTTFARAGIAIIDRLNERIGRIVSWLMLLMVAVTFAVVVLRYLFDTGWVAMQESVIDMHALLFMVGAAYTLKHDAHVRVDIIYQHCSPKRKAWIDLFGSLFLLLPVAGFIAWSCWDYVIDSWEIHESSRNAGGLPGVYLIKSSILLMAVLLALQGVAMILSNILVLAGADLARQSDHG